MSKVQVQQVTLATAQCIMPAGPHLAIGGNLRMKEQQSSGNRRVYHQLEMSVKVQMRSMQLEKLAGEKQLKAESL